MWESNNCSYYYDISSFLYAIKRGEVEYDFSLKSKYISGEEISTPQEQQALVNNYDIIYTDNNHPICLSPNKSYIDKVFFEKNKEEIINEIRRKILKEDEYKIVVINKYIFSADFLKQLIKKYNGQHLIFKETNLSQEQIDLLKKNHIHAEEIKNGIKQTISTDTTYRHYKYTDIKQATDIQIYTDINDDEISNFKNLNNLIITIKNDETDEETYYKKLTHILKQFDSLNTNLIIRIECEKRSILNKYIEKYNLKNIELLINNDSYDYPLEEYKREDNILNCMVKTINDSDCTPFEKYIAVYNIVKNYKPYREVDDESYEQSRNIRYILNNDYMVCVGYAKLLRELLEKVGIESKIHYTSVDTSYDEGFTYEDKPINFSKHARVIVNLIDKEYNINGYYVSDPTWDNNAQTDKYSNMIMPFDYMQKSRRLFKLEEIDYIFDVHNLNEFNQKIEKLFTKKLNAKTRKKPKYKSDRQTKYQNDVLDTYNEITHLIIETIKNIDFEKYKEISQIWYPLIYGNNNFSDSVNYYKYFISYISTYIVKKSNNYINKDTIIKAIANSKIKTYKLFPQDYDSYLKELSEQFDNEELFFFPYEFPDNYLSEEDDGITIRKKIL